MFQFGARGLKSDSARLAAAILDLVDRRAGTICPSEAARAVGGEQWRELMQPARDAARELARAGRVEITQRGIVVEPDGEWRGPIRIGRPSRRRADEDKPID